MEGIGSSMPRIEGAEGQVEGQTRQIAVFIGRGTRERDELRTNSKAREDRLITITKSRDHVRNIGER